MKLSSEELGALQNLADKRAGQEVDWISISHARALTEFGLARRIRSGWEITDAGLQLLRADPAARADALDRTETKAPDHGQPGAAAPSSVVTGYFAGGRPESSNDPEGAEPPS